LIKPPNTSNLSLSSHSRQSEVGHLLTESLSRDVPAIQLMAAISLANDPVARHGEFDRAQSLFLKVLKKSRIGLMRIFGMGDSLTVLQLKNPKPRGRLSSSKVSIIGNVQSCSTRDCTIVLCPANRDL
jgi:hypothetical protein